MKINKNLGIIYLAKNIDRYQFTIVDAYNAIKPLSPYYGTSYDITNIELSFDNTEEVTVLFKAVHFSVPTASTIPYTQVTFKKV